ncbi:hypothetical protein BDY19DRAFT_996416 [Irpex rosettiformis]|uniref:Uncharacterized protein n=1 Tax=Irpex rosettiformis TaxID=378272 RepID=A0ACB8TUL3_9APHY|nr:hypothetical protein BDY19DRAFT_996416 [Irpex rosettiformis]
MAANSFLTLFHSFLNHTAGAELHPSLPHFTVTQPKASSMATNKGKDREVRQPPTRPPRSRSRRRATSEDEDTEMEEARSRSRDRRSRSRSRRRDRIGEGRHKRRPRSHSWAFARQIGVLTHSEGCPKCSAWIAHRATAHQGESFRDAQIEEENFWVDWVHSWDGHGQGQRSSPSQRRTRSLSPPRKRARQHSSPIEDPTPTQATETLTRNDEREQRITYLEDVAELLRRQLERVGVITTNTWSTRACEASLEELCESRSNYEYKPDKVTREEREYWEDSEDEHEDPERRKARRRKECLKKGMWRTRTTTSSSRSMNSKERGAVNTKRRPAPPLEERLEQYHPQPGPYHRDQGGASSTTATYQWPLQPQGAPSRTSLGGRLSQPLIARTLQVAVDPQTVSMARVINPSKPPRETSYQLSTGMFDANSIGPHVVHLHYLEERDSERRIVPLTTQHQGKFRIVYGVVLDLGRPFPSLPPNCYMRNPITGYYWSQTELEAYPRGFPGLPAECPPTGEVGQGGRRIIPYNHMVMSTMDNSQEMMRVFENPVGVGGSRWRAPTTAEEVRMLRDIAAKPANTLALAHYGKLVDEAGRVGAANRSVGQQALVANRGDRPLWAEYKPPKSKGQKSRARQKRALNAPLNPSTPVIGGDGVGEPTAEVPPAMEVGETSLQPPTAIVKEDLEMGEVTEGESRGITAEDSPLTEDELIDFEVE